MSAPARKLQPEQLAGRIANAFADRVLAAWRIWQDDAPAGEPRRLSARWVGGEERRFAPDATSGRIEKTRVPGNLLRLRGNSLAG
jgi:hypothetical protein